MKTLETGRTAKLSLFVNVPGNGNQSYRECDTHDFTSWSFKRKRRISEDAGFDSRLSDFFLKKLNFSISN